MAKTALRSYGKEIESLIDRGQYDQALAHCRHILRYYPKHIDTYRLMAKAYLEATRYGDASDVFQRVLSSIPDDFVSQLGMSIIREDEGNLDAAIWHMERAFEIQPSNVAIQSELRRLYGRRDGMEPPRVRLTRGALSRMYLKGELYQQAISELRAALNADPSRTDLQVVLAQAYQRAGQRVEAADACSAVLKKLPYCLEANRILAEIMSTSERAQDAAIYRQRATAMNPYIGQLSPKAPSPELVPDEAVVIERLDLKAEPAAHGEPSQPAWAASLGVAIETGSQHKEEVPDWLADLEGISQPQPTDQQGAVSGPPKVSPFIISDMERNEFASFTDQTSQIEGETSEDLIPDWMQEAGWMPSKEVNPEAEKGFTLDDELAVDDTGLAPAEIPIWLREIAPKEAFEPPEQSMDVDPRLVEALDAAGSPWLDEPSSERNDSLTSWLEDKEKAEPPQEEAYEAPAGGTGISTAEAAAGAAAGLAAWAAMQDRQPDEATPAGEIPAEQAEALPDWLTGQESSEAPVFETEPGLPMGAEAELVWDELSPAEDAAPGEIPDWLKTLGAADEVSPEESEETPDWLKELAPVVAMGSLVDKSDELVLEEEAPIIEELDSGEWLPESFGLEEEALTAGLAAGTVEMGAGPQDTIETSLPEWLRAVNPDELMTAETEATADVGSLPDWLREMESGEETAIAEVGDEVPSWIPVMPTSAAQEAKLDWMPGTPTGEELHDLDWFETTPSEPESLDAWLLTEAQQVQETPPSDLEEGELPEWLAASALEEPDLPLETPIETAALAIEVMPEETTPLPEPQTLEEEREKPLAEVPAWLGLGIAAKELADREAQPEEELTPVASELEAQPDLEAAVGEPADEETITLTGEKPGVPPGQAPEMSEEDSAFAWLESLAVKQGATEALMYSEEERPEEPPEWVKAEAEKVTEAQIQPLEEVPVEVSEETSMEAAVIDEGAPEAEEAPLVPDWLLEVAAAGAIVDEVIEHTAHEPIGQEVVEVEEIAVTPEVPVSEDITAVEEIAVIPEEAEKQVVEAVESAGQEPQAGEQADIDAAYAWLEGLAVKQGAEEALLLSPEERQEEPPEWVKAEAEAVAVDELSVGIPEQALEAPALEEQPEVDEETPVGLYAAGVLAAAAAEETDSGVVETPVEETSIPAAVEAEDLTEAEPVPDLPDWLADLEEEEEPSAAGTAWAPEEELAVPQAEEPELEDMLAPLEPTVEIARLDINRASLIELERLPGVGFVRAQALIDYRREYGPLSGMDDLENVEGFDSELVDMLKEYAEVTAQPAQALHTISIGERVAGLDEARGALAQGDIKAAIRGYQAAINQTELLPDIIKDLNDALYRYPVDVSIWMTLGDAEMRSGNVQEALDAYTKAEELLR